MGIGITGISKAKLLPCSNDDNCPCLVQVDEDEFQGRDGVFSVDVPGRGDDVVPLGCYVAGRGGRTYSLDFSNAGYRGWIRRLCLMAIGVEPEEIWNHPDRFWVEPFIMLILGPSIDGGAIGPIRSAYLYDDFVTFAPKAKKYYATSTPNVFNPPRVKPEVTTGKSRRKRKGGAAAGSQDESIGDTMPEWDEGENLDWMWESYKQFRRAFRLAKNAGMVVFY